MSDIIFNNQKYILAELLKLVGQAIKIKAEPSLIIGLETAPKDHLLDYPIVVALGEKYQVLVAPGKVHESPYRKYNLMSKIILKKAKVPDPTLVRAMRQDDDRPRDGYSNAPKRPDSNYGYRPQQMHPIDRQRMQDRYNNPNSNRS